MVPSSGQQPQKLDNHPPWFSRQATSVWDDYWERKQPIRVISPDGKKTVIANFTGFSESTEHIIFTVIASDKEFKVDIGLGVGSEVAWSPDSKAFFVTSSEQGRNGWFHTQIYFLEDGGLKKVDPTREIERAFGQPVVCAWPESPNVAAVGWLDGSGRILLAAQILHHTVCDSFGTFKLYEVALPEAKILKSYNQIVAKRLFWSLLGDELRRADDNCIRDRKSCEVPANHPERR